MTRICIVGAGAVGGYLGARLAQAGEAVNVLARGATLQALQTVGLCLTEDGVTHTLPVHATDTAAALGAQDLVIVAVKAPALENVAAGIAPLIGPDTCVVVAMNGVPWWFSSAPVRCRACACRPSTRTAALRGRSRPGTYWAAWCT